MSLRRFLPLRADTAELGGQVRGVALGPALITSLGPRFSLVGDTVAFLGPTLARLRSDVAVLVLTFTKIEGAVPRRAPQRRTPSVRRAHGPPAHALSSTRPATPDLH
jgi:hypothetical protein